MRKTTILLLMTVLMSVGAAAHAELTDNGNGTVTDSTTGLIWQQGDPGLMTWGSALSYCEGLDLGGSTSWRLPNIKELQSLVDSPNLSASFLFFQNVQSYYYWSSTTDAHNPGHAAWRVYFGSYLIDTQDKHFGYSCRIVRGGQTGALPPSYVPWTNSSTGQAIRRKVDPVTGAMMGWNWISPPMGVGAGWSASDYLVR